MNAKSLSQEIAELVEQKISSSKKSITFQQAKDAALKLSLKTNGKGRSISTKKKEMAVNAVDRAAFNDIKDNLKDEDIQRTVINDISSVPDEMLRKVSASKQLLKKFIGMIVRGAILKILSQTLFQKGSLLLGGLGLAGGGVNAIADSSAANFYTALDPHKYFTENQIEVFQDFLPTSEGAMGGEVPLEIASITPPDASVGSDTVDIDVDVDVDVGVDSDTATGLADILLSIFLGV